MANGGEWRLYGFRENEENREFIAVFDTWNGILSWMKNDWSNSPYHGLIILPDEEMSLILKMEDAGRHNV